jgi:beta-glucosidase/6-phospho-beta-glucosidase/beta-galactosidase
MTAAEARKISNSITDRKAVSMLQNINLDIELAAEMGKTCIRVSKIIPLSVRKDLESRGFTLWNSPNPIDGDSTITW